MLGERFLQRQKIAPGEALLQRAAQQESGVECRQRADFARAGIERQPAAARPCDAFLGAEQRLHRRAAEADQDIRVRQLDLTADERQADRGLLRRRRAVAGRPPRHDIGDIGERTIEPDRRHHQVEKLAGAADERPSRDVLVISGRFADEHDAALRIAVGENELGCGSAQRAALEIREQRTQFIERLGASRGRARRHDCRLGRRPGPAPEKAAFASACARRRLRCRAREVGPHRAGRRLLIRHAVDRLLADDSVGAGIKVEGEQFAHVASRDFGVPGSWLAIRRLSLH